MPSPAGSTGISSAWSAENSGTEPRNSLPHVRGLESPPAPLAAHRRALVGLGAVILAVVLHLGRAFAHALLGEGFARARGSVLAFHGCPLKRREFTNSITCAER